MAPPRYSASEGFFVALDAGIFQTWPVVGTSQMTNRKSEQDDSLGKLLKIYERAVEADKMCQFMLEFFDNLPIPAWIKIVHEDGSLRMMRVNSVYVHQVSVDTQSYIGQTDKSIWGADVARVFYANDLRVQKSGSGIEITEPAHGKTWKGFKWPIKDHNGRVVAICGMAEGIPDVE